MQTREAVLTQLRNRSKPWDLVVVGGGITGAGVLLEAANAGLDAVLIEQQGYAWGTSSRSSKMVHGGLRYLAQGDVGLTRHSVQEREYLLKALPGLVHPLEYHYVLGPGTPPRWAVKLLLSAYDWLAGVSQHHYLSGPDFALANPGFNAPAARAAYAYQDAETHDSRLVLRVLQEAVERGGSCANYCCVTGLLQDAGHITGVQVQDTLNQQGFEIKTRAIVNATGAWADRLRHSLSPEVNIRPQRGSHLVFSRQRLAVDHALTLRHPEDGRYHFIYPWCGRTLVGTTDLDYREDLDSEAAITPAEVDYLLASANHFYPESRLSRQDIISSFSGVRPIISSGSGTDPSKERRAHAVWVDQNLVTVSGGKLTTFRLIAQDVIGAVEALLGRSLERTEPWISPVEVSVDSLLSQGAELAPDYIARYGNNAALLVHCALSEQRVDELLPISDTRYSLADVRWVLRHEQVQSLADVLLRHTPLGLILPGGGQTLFESLQHLLAEERGLDEAECQRWFDEYLAVYQRAYSVS